MTLNQVIALSGGLRYKRASMNGPYFRYYPDAVIAFEDATAEDWEIEPLEVNGMKDIYVPANKEQWKKIGCPLIRLIEECSEVIHIACKIQRFGWFNFHPDDPNKTPNIGLLKEEMGQAIDTYIEIINSLAKPNV